MLELYTCCGKSKEIAEPKGLEVIPYEIIVPLGSINTSPDPPPTPCPSYSPVWYATVPVVFVQVNTGEFPGNPAAYVPGVFIAVTKLGTHLDMYRIPQCLLDLYYLLLLHNMFVHLLLHSQQVPDL